MCEISLEYIDGYMRCLSNGCHGCDYVPFYDAERFRHERESVLDSLVTHLGINEFSLKHHRKLKDFVLLSDEDWQSSLDSMLKKWIDNKYFSGRLVSANNDDSEFLEVYKDDLLEQLTMLAGDQFTCFSASVEHENYEYGCEVFGFVGEKSAFYLHFSFSD